MAIKFAVREAQQAERRRNRERDAASRHYSENSSRRSSTQRREPHGGPMTVPLVASIPVEEREYLRNKFRLRSDKQLFDGVRDVIVTQILVGGQHVEDDDVDPEALVSTRYVECPQMHFMSNFYFH